MSQQNLARYRAKDLEKALESGTTKRSRSAEMRM